MDVEKILSNLVRVGIVTAVNNDKHLARVTFEDTKLPSGWLVVLDNRPFIPDYAAPQVTDKRAGGSGFPQYESHDHPLTIKQWMPQINQPVLVLYLPVKNADGFILGGMQ